MADDVLSPEREALEMARAIAAQSNQWIDVWNALFGIGGVTQRLFPTSSDRAKFAGTHEYRQIMQLIDELRETGAPTPAADASGKFLLRLPRSLHAALIAEAEAEGVSLNQLCMAKLASQLRSVV